MLFSLKLSKTFIYSGFFREGGDRGAAAAAVPPDSHASLPEQEEAEADLGQRWASLGLTWGGGIFRCVTHTCNM